MTSTAASSGPFVRCLFPRPPSATSAASASATPSTSQSHKSSRSSSSSSDANTRNASSSSSKHKKRSRLVLLQHTSSLTTRLTASCPASSAPSANASNRRKRLAGSGSVATSSAASSRANPSRRNGNTDSITTEDDLYRLAGLRTPSESATRDLAGSTLLPLKALEEIVLRTNGRVIWIRVAGTADRLLQHVVDDESSDDIGGGWVEQFRRYGVTVDLASDPLGWDCEEGEQREEEKQHHHRTFMSRLDNLRSIVEMIDRASSSITSSSPSSSSSLADDDGEIPVVMDSLTPLINLHGAAQTLRLLRHLLGRGNCTGSSIVDGGRKHTSTTLSPLVVPVSIESIRSADMRHLEDQSDAIVTLVGGELRTARRGGGDGKEGGAAGRLINDIQPLALTSSTETSTGGAAAGYEQLTLIAPTRKDVGTKQKIKPAKPSGAKAGNNALPATIVSGERLAAMELSKAQTRPASKASVSRGRPTLKIGEDGRTGTAAADANDHSLSTQQPNKSSPRIFVQDDDPEYEDMDDEDLDDDLDL